jgi:hypothetical protein
MISEPERAHLGMEQADRIACSASSERKLFEQTSSARRRSGAPASSRPAAHLGEAHLHAGFGKLPGGLRAGEAAADDVDVVETVLPDWQAVDLYA